MTGDFAFLQQPSYLLLADDALEALVVPLPRLVLHLLHSGPERFTASVAPEQESKFSVSGPSNKPHV